MASRPFSQTVFAITVVSKIKGGNSMPILNEVSQAITAVGGLGTAAFGLVDATKVFWGGINHVGFGGISKRIQALMPETGAGVNALPVLEAINTLKGNWFNGTDLTSQKAIAKSLVKLHLNTANAPAVAKATNTDPDLLATVAGKMTTGTALLPAESDAFARFDLILTAMLDETYQMADQVYTNGARALAVVFSVGLAFAGSWILAPDKLGSNWGEALIIGLLATPLAPIAKDLSSSLAAAVNALQAVRK
jgi:hypothetical protein